ncbi:hypothetical protein AYJ56_17335 [Brucella anthropi]|nr:hypothetical protein AYJ56_17335 [Brucella anthropi]
MTDLTDEVITRRMTLLALNRSIVWEILTSVLPFEKRIAKLNQLILVYVIGLVLLGFFYGQTAQ